jgi:hypothetical protein
MERFAAGLVPNAGRRAAALSVQVTQAPGSPSVQEASTAVVMTTPVTMPKVTPGLGRQATYAARAAAFAAVPQADVYPALPHLVESNPAWAAARDAEQSCQARLLRCIVGSPFRPLAPRPFPAGVTGLAGAVYGGDSGLYAVLADALEDLGEPAAAAHCREPQHAKGCHIVDWILGRG